jgi:heme-degrading monooxygenase HmoA
MASSLLFGGGGSERVMGITNPTHRSAAAEHPPFRGSRGTGTLVANLHHGAIRASLEDFGRGRTMFIAMNRFRIARGREGDFETLWRNRESQLDGVPGFREFHLLRGPEDEEATLYASHSVWNSRQAFESWTESENFRKAHAQARAPSGTYLGHPRFEGFEVVL